MLQAYMETTSSIWTLHTKRKPIQSQTLHGQCRFKNWGWRGHTAGYTLPWKQLRQAIGIFPRAHRPQIILSSLADSNLLGCHRHGPHWDSIPSTSRSKADQFELPIGKPKQLVRLHARASSRPGSLFYLSCCLATTDHPVHRPGSQARRHRGAPGCSTDSPGVMGCQGVRHAHWGRKPNAPISGYALRWSSYD